MRKMRKIKRDHMRALLSEVLPYEAPLPFNNLELFRFLRRINFEWSESAKRFTVSTKKLKDSEEWWLRTLFDQVDIQLTSSSDGLTTGLVPRGDKPRKVQPYKFNIRTNNGKIRELAILHPHSMLDVARYIRSFEDSILYFTNRSLFSIRHPSGVARLEKKRDGLFEDNRTQKAPSLEQHNLEYDSITRYFSYEKYSHISKFYSSSEFQACERKYPTLMRTDVASCFPSIYSHTISWVTNGRHPSKTQTPATSNTFGGKFDELVQALNYGETSGVVVGPEFSRIFAEIILQEVDIRIEQDLAKKGLEFGKNYEAMRYVDDYFFFLSRASDAVLVEEILARHLAHFKLHLNANKKEVLSTPLRSEISVAKHRIHQNLKRFTKVSVDLEAPDFKLSFSSRKAIMEYKSVLIDADLNHGDIANYYLYSLLTRVSKVSKKARKFLEALAPGDARAAQQKHVARLLTKYLASVMDVAFFVYAGAPSSSHGIKLAQLMLTSIRELKVFDTSSLDVAVFEDKMRREIDAQLQVVSESGELGVHTLNLLDCFVHLKGEPSGHDLSALLKSRKLEVAELEVFEILVLLRACGSRESTKEFRSHLLARAETIITLGKHDPDLLTQRTILLLSLSTNPYLSTAEIKTLTGQKKGLIVQHLAAGGMSLFSWNIDDHYLEHLLLKSSQMVY